MNILKDTSSAKAVAGHAKSGESIFIGSALSSSKSQCKQVEEGFGFEGFIVPESIYSVILTWVGSIEIKKNYFKSGFYFKLT